jgi:hypothetical protein
MRREKMKASVAESARIPVPTAKRMISDWRIGATTCAPGTVTALVQPEYWDRLNATRSEACPLASVWPRTIPSRLLRSPQNRCGKVSPTASTPLESATTAPRRSATVTDQPLVKCCPKMIARTSSGSRLRLTK